jgi:hypothetical protein
MGVNSITGTTTNNYETKTYKKETSAAASGTTSRDTAAKDTGVIYEKSTDTKTSGVTKKTDTALVAKLKADAEERTSQLRSLVEKMMTKQSIAIGTADDMWKFLAKGDFTVDAETKAQAEADIAEDGYWGVEQTSERILDFAKALSGNDPDKADLLLDAFKKGFKEATKTWGDELPDISKRTYDAVLEKFDKWKNGTSDTTTDATETN